MPTKSSKAKTKSSTTSTDEEETVKVEAVLKVTKLVSNLVGVAKIQDPNLQNAWGSVIDKDSVWIAANGSGVLVHYNLKGKLLGTPVNVPSGATGATGATGASGATAASNPSGLVINNTRGFVITKGGKSAASYLLVATENGIIAGYNKLVDPLNAVIVVNNSASGAVYKGLAIAGNFLYATDFHNGVIDVFDFSFTPITTFPFVDTNTTTPIPAGYGPFNIVNIHDKLYVTYAKQLAPANHDDQAGVGNGYISLFQTNGTFIRRLVSGGKLNSPWGLAVAPDSFGELGGLLLVGNFGDGYINAYDRKGAYIATLKTKHNKKLVITGLWSLVRTKEAPDYVFFTAGPNAEVNGLFGNLHYEQC